MPIFTRVVDTWYVNYLLLHEKQHTAIYLNQNSVNRIISLLFSARLTHVSTDGQWSHVHVGYCAPISWSDEGG